MSALGICLRILICVGRLYAEKQELLLNCAGDLQAWRIRRLALLAVYPFFRVFNQLGRISDIQLLSDMLPVGLDCFYAYVELLCNLAVFHFLADQPEYFQLTVGKPFNRVLIAAGYYIVDSSK